jgi:hypothetical protein
MLTPPDQPNELRVTLDPTAAAIAHLSYGETGALTNQPGPWLLVAKDADVAAIRAELRDEITVDGTTHHRLSADALEDIGIVVYHGV